MIKDTGTLRARIGSFGSLALASTTPAQAN